MSQLNITTTQEHKDDIEAYADQAVTFFRDKTPAEIGTVILDKLNSGDPADTKQVIEFLARTVAYLVRCEEK